MERRLVVDSTTSEKYMRIASISIAFYDYIITLPAEWRFYRSQSSFFHMSIACTLFILIRYFSILAIVVSNYGYFSSTFTLQTCQQFYVVAPVFKAVQSMVSQLILGVRTFNIARRDRRIGIALLVLYIVAISAEWFADLYNRTPVMVDVRQCSLERNLMQTTFLFRETNAGKVLSTWFYYLALMIYDIVMVTVSTMHLLRYNPLSTRVERLIRVLIYDGIGYFIMLSGNGERIEPHPLSYDRYRHPVGRGINRLCCNVDYEPTDPHQYTRCAQPQCLTSVPLTLALYIRSVACAPLTRKGMSEPGTQRLENVIVARPTLSAQKKVTSGLRSQFESKSHSKGCKSPINAEFRPTSGHSGHADDIELGVRVRVERSVVVDYKDDSEHSSSWGPQGAK
ncbi:hypothetical protein DEU56DRAFT_928417 [Suillus clintonianus]|uniref:uncharacterized protein n=1 Tax=Suillus clintonianus TaxID=1904413 RepID=UPI001B882293|nr:uncharacterized protein DEU56DRAFT_928417 [Suillus clintonianus]KAG2120387.1 hypothetical protein DEU56DRAFT_928417 [Suillus clintonianus]